MLFNSAFFIYGNASFITNSVSLQNNSLTNNFGGGGAIYCLIQISTLMVKLCFSFINVANAYAPLDDDESSIQSQGGAMSARSGALIFENTSSTIFRENNSTHLGGAISISKGATLTIRRGARSIFHKNCA